MSTFRPVVGTLGELLELRRAAQPEDLAFIYLKDGAEEADRLTFGELHRAASSLASTIRQRAAVGSRILLIHPPGLQFVIAFFACSLAGMTAVPLAAPRRREGDARLVDIVRTARPALGISTGRLLARHDGFRALNIEGRPGAALTWIDQDAEAGLGTWGLEDPTGVVPALIQFTSGSTGAPRGVVVSHHNLLSNQEMICDAFSHGPDTVVVSWLPTFHDMGLIGTVLQPVFLGRPCILMAPLAFVRWPLRWLEAISRYRATTSGGPCFGYSHCVAALGRSPTPRLDLSSWTLAFNGAEPVRASTLSAFASAFAPMGFRPEAFYPCYGLAEATLLVSGGEAGRAPSVLRLDVDALERGQARSWSPGRGRHQEVVSSGRLRGDLRVEIVDPMTGRRCDEGAQGEIWLAGDTVAQGYFACPEATAATFGGSLLDGGDGPFLRTGDLGFLREGELYVTGRLKDLIVICGRNLHPHDVEDVAQRSHPALGGLGAAAFAVDGEHGEALVVVQEVDALTVGPGGDSAQVIRAAVVQAVTRSFDVGPRDVVLAEAGTLPRTTSGKVRRQACRQAYLSGALPVWTPLSQIARPPRSNPASVLEA